MYNKNVNFEFIGFVPEAEVKSFITSIAHRLHGLAPSNSFMNFILKKKGDDVVEASCRIASRVGEFLVDTVSKDPVAAIQQIESRMKQKLDEWKKLRFLENRCEGNSSGQQLENAV
jgi:hypothetical protein